MSNPQVPISGSIGSAGPFPTLGATSIALTGISHTLADPSETCYQYIILTGTAAPVVAPLVKGFTYLVVNETAGTVSFGGATGGTVAIPAGSAAWCSTDGTNWTQAGAAAVTPLSRTVFVDGGYTGGGSNGSISAPYTTISAALAAIPQPASTNDANSTWQIWVAPTLGGYTSEPGGTIALPAYRNIVIQGTPVNPLANPIAQTVFPSASTTAAVTWANTAARGGAHTPTSAARVAFKDFNINNSVTITDDNTVNSELYFFRTSATTVVSTATLFLLCLFDEQSYIAGIVNTPTAEVLLNNDTSIDSGGCACTSLTLGVSASVDGTITCSGGVVLDTGSEVISGSVLNAQSLVVNQGVEVAGTTVTLTGGADTLTAVQGYFTGGQVTCGAATLYDCVFSGGFQLVATTVSTDAVSWQSYLAQGGAPHGTITIRGQSASTYNTAADFPQGLAVTPATSPGTPILAFNLTPTQTGMIRLEADILVDTAGPDAPAFAVFVAAGTATGGVSEGPGCLAGDTGNPLTVPGSPTLIGLYQNLGAAVTGVQSTTISNHADSRALGTAMCIWIQAASSSGSVAWTFSFNASAKEDPLN
jgi:hypothetical protein